MRMALGEFGHAIDIFLLRLFGSLRIHIVEADGDRPVEQLGVCPQMGVLENPPRADAAYSYFAVVIFHIILVVTEYILMSGRSYICGRLVYMLGVVKLVSGP